MGHVYGYARVSTKSQSLDIQIKELEAAGCKKIFGDKASGKNTDRQGFLDLQDTLLEGDTVVICKLDRIGRNLQDLIGIVNQFNDKGIGFKVLDNAAIDTTTPAGKLVFTVFAAVSEYERHIILERTEKGREAARRSGRLGGRKRTISDQQIESVTKLMETMPCGQACAHIGITRQSYYRILRNGQKRSSL